MYIALKHAREPSYLSSSLPFHHFPLHVGDRKLQVFPNTSKELSRMYQEVSGDNNCGKQCGTTANMVFPLMSYNPEFVKISNL